MTLGCPNCGDVRDVRVQSTSSLAAGDAERYGLRSLLPSEPAAMLRQYVCRRCNSNFRAAEVLLPPRGRGKPRKGSHADVLELIEPTEPEPEPEHVQITREQWQILGEGMVSYAGRLNALESELAQLRAKVAGT